ncbi:choice-of-anchor D domain-containing protein [Granulicella sp. dw_53]|uniref:choice-of-anchor D domain-containing protein n=1 Tax=Granulicella sp. dw_53 TaxID=2719792 RepID=UPI001BD3F4C9
MLIAVGMLTSTAMLHGQEISFAGLQTTLTVTALPSPTAIAIDSSGTRYLVDNNSTDITVLNAVGTQTLISSTLLNPSAITLDSAGNIYVADYGNNRVLKIPVGGGAQIPVGTGLLQPNGVAVDSLGNVYIDDQGNSRVVKVTTGGTQTQVAAASINYPTSVAVDSADNLYVLDSGNRTIEKVTPDGTFSMVMPQNSLENYPQALALDKVGNAYVTNSGYQTVQMYSPSGKVRFLGNGMSTPAGLAIDSTGNVYVADYSGGSVKIISPGAVALGSANLCPASATPSPCSQTVTLNFNVDPNSDFSTVTARVVTQGTLNLDFVVTSDTCTGLLTQGSTCSVTATFKPLAPGIRLGAVQVSGLSVPSNNFVSPRGSGTRNIVLPRGEPPAAGLLATVYLHGQGIGPLAGFDAGVINTLPIALQTGGFPRGIATDSAGNVYTSDNQNCVVQQFAVATSLTSTIAGSGACGPLTGNGGPAIGATFQDPLRIAISGSGDIYIADDSSCVIQKVDALTGIMTTVAGTVGVCGHTADGVQATSATLTQPGAVAVDGTGNIYIADVAEHLIRKVDASTGILSTVAGNYVSGIGFSGDGGAATSAQLSSPDGISLDSLGNLYITDNGNNVVRKITVGTGIITTIAGIAPTDAGAAPGSTCGYSGDNGLATLAALCDPEGVSVDAAGNVYIADSSNFIVRKVSANTGLITTVAGVYNGGGRTGTEAYTGDGAAANLAGLSYLEDVTVDGSGNIYIADSDNNVVRKVAVANGVLSFGTVTVGASSLAKDVMVTNNGNASLNVSSLLASANFNLSGAHTTCSASSTLSLGASCVLGVEFLPTAAGALNGTVTLADNVGNDPTSMQSVTANGTGTYILQLKGIPATIAAGGNLGTIQVLVESSDGTVVTSANAPITLTITGPGGYSQTVTTTSVNGVATFNLSSTTYPAVGTYSATASSPGVTSTVPVQFIVTLPATQLALTGVAPTVAAGGNQGTIGVSVESSDGEVVPSANSAITLTIVGPNAYSQTVTGVAANGLAVFDLRSLSYLTPGSYTMTASSPGLTSATAPFTVTPPVASQLAVTGVAPTLTAGGSQGTVGVAVQSSNGTVVSTSNASITLTITGPNGFSQTVTAAAVNGLASFNLSAIPYPTAGNYTVTASSTGLTSATAPFVVTPITVQATKLALTGVAATLVSGGNLGVVNVAAQSANSAVVLTANIPISVTITGPNGFTRTVTATTTNGIAAVNLSGISYPTAGKYLVTASSTGLTSSTATFVVTAVVLDFSLNLAGTPSTQTVVPGAAAVYVFTLAPTNVVFPGAITLTASGLPPGATYSFVPPTVTPGPTAVSTTLTIQTAKPVAIAGSIEGLGGIILALLIPLTVSRRVRRAFSKVRLLTLLAYVFSAGALIGLSGCGSNNGFFGQPQQTFTITITGTSGSLQHSTSVVLNVQ